MSFNIEEAHLKLYEHACKEDTTWFEFYLKSIAFHFSLVSALLGATVAGALQAEPGFPMAALLAGPIMTAFAAYLGFSSANRLYGTWLEKVTIRAKLEQKMGLTAEHHVETGYWSNESIVPTRNTADRSSFSSSREFIEAKLGLGYNLRTRRLFEAASAVALAMFVGIGWTAYSTWPSLVPT